MLTLRAIVPSDLDMICDHREKMFLDGGKRTKEDLISMVEPFRLWLKPRLLDATYFGFIAEKNGQPVGGIGLMVIDWPPHPLHPTDDRRGYVLNMLVEPEHRGQGIAKKLMKTADKEFSDRGITYAILHTTTKGRPLYESENWMTTTEMAKILEPTV